MKKRTVYLLTLIVVFSCNNAQEKQPSSSLEVEKQLVNPNSKTNSNSQKNNHGIEITCIDKGFYSEDYEDFITYTFRIKNNSEQNVRAIKGTLTFSNVFDETIKSLDFVYDHLLLADSNVNWYTATEYNQFRDSDRELKNKALHNLKVSWESDKIIYTEDN